jgi:hypothetical protein
MQEEFGVFFMQPKTTPGTSISSYGGSNLNNRMAIMPPIGSRGSVYLNNHAVKKVNIDLSSVGDKDSPTLVMAPTESNLKKLE